MKKDKYTIFLLMSLLLFYGCQDAKKGFSGKNIDEGEEFLVIKKNPLVVPPDFEKMPLPKNKVNNTNSIKVENTQSNEFKKLLPGHYLKGNINDIKSIKTIKFYSVTYNGKYLTEDSESDLINKLEKHLLKAVDRQMLSDVPLGFFLSGGLDSSILVAMARKLNPKREINCYTIKTESMEGFTDDLFYAKKVAEHLNVNLKIIEAAEKNAILTRQEESTNALVFSTPPEADFSVSKILDLLKKMIIDNAG